MNFPSKTNNLLRQNNSIPVPTERFSSLCTLPSIIEEPCTPISFNPSCKLLAFPSTDSSLYPNIEVNAQVQQDCFSSFGSVKFYGIRSTCFKDFPRNKIRIISQVPKPESLKFSKWPRCSFFGLYTGHSGNSCASFLKKNLHKCIFESLHFPHSPKKAIFEGFLKADSLYLKLAQENCNFSGAFAVVVLIIGKKCYVANTGKTRAVISMNNGTRVIPVSCLHSPENSNEADRVLSAGGRVYKDFIIEKNGGKQEIGQFKIVPGKKEFTRSFGDPDSKFLQFGGIPNTIIPDPHIKSFKISEFCDLLCLTSENITPHFDDQLLVNTFWKPVNEPRPSDSPITQRLDYLQELFIERCKGNSSILLIGLTKLNYE